MPKACIANRDRTDDPANPESSLPFGQFIVFSMTPPGRFWQSMRAALEIGPPDLANGAAKESLVRRASQSMLEDVKPHLRDATVVIDGSSSKEFRSQLSAYLKKRINPAEGDQHIKRVKIQDSKKNNLIQLADMVCGAGRNIPCPPA